MPRPLNGNGRYMAGLDGLRALAVLSVIAYHLNLGWAPGGLLGVGVFFVLSGYLITDILVSEWSTHQRIDLKDFWFRRARRLLPAMFTMLVVVGAWMMFSDRSQLPSLREDILAAVLYVSNWWLIFHKVSYFASFGQPSPLGHLWSLAVEEQFYLLWPLLLALGLRYIPRRRNLVLLTLTAAAVSAVAMALLFEPGIDPSRVYYGTDTRVFALLIGASLAFLWPSRKLSNQFPAKACLTLDLAGGTGLLLILLMIWKSNQYEDFLYEGGMVLVSVATAIVVAALAHPASHLGKLMGTKPLRWLGIRSYGIYLWHYPVIVLTSPVGNADGINSTRAILQVIASIGLAALSWWLLEEPIRHGAIGRIWTLIRSRVWRKEKVIASLWVAFVSSIFVLSVICINADRFFQIATASSSILMNPEPAWRQEQLSSPKPTEELLQNSASSQAEPKKSETSANQQQLIPTMIGLHTSHTSKGTKPPVPNSNHGGSAQKATTKGVPDQTNSGQTNSGQATSGHGVTAIGDSVMVDIAPELTKLLPGAVIDGKIGRQLSQAQDVVNQLKAEGKLGSRVILELGTNGAFSEKQLVSLLNSLDGVQQIILVNTRVPRPWETVVNTTLADVAETMPNVTIVNWYEASAGKNSYFYPDGVHLNPEGAKVYAALIAKALKPESPAAK